MIKIKKVPREGFENYFYPSIDQKDNIQKKLEDEYNKAVEELKAKYENELAEQTKILDEIIKLASVEVEVEVPDEEEPAEEQVNDEPEADNLTEDGGETIVVE